MQYAVLRLTPTQDMEPWLSLARWELEVDGQNWATSGYGRVERGVTTGELRDAMHFIDNFHVQCAPGSTDAGPGGDDRLGPGVHSARVLARVAGFPGTIASNTVSITFDCATDTWDAGAGPVPDGGQSPDGGCVDDLDAGSFCPPDGGPPFDGGFIDAGASADAGIDPQPESQGCGGCAHLPVEALLPLAILVALRRRQVRPAP